MKNVALYLFAASITNLGQVHSRALQN